MAGPTRRVQYVQTGGFAGLKMTADVDLSSLPAEEAIAFEQLIERAVAEPAPITSVRPAPDGQQYQVTIARDDGDVVLRGSDPDLAPGFAALVAQLQPRAAPGS
jgi:hypothetical protein